MSLAVLKWLANGMVAVVLMATLWMAHSLSQHHARAELLAQNLPGTAASAPASLLR